ncbi:MAG: polyprenyl synthetase family protein, partial [Planctomycetota bacterium]
QAPLRELVESTLQQWLAQTPYPANLRAAVAHALLSGGKRLRPVLTLAACEAAGGRADQALSAAAALECVHAFSLVHDDLPALDDDDLRRGKPTVHVAFGEAMAILAGDALLALAFEWIASRSASPAQAGALTRLLSEATRRMIEGQVYDTLGGVDPSLSEAQQLERTHRCKTGALLEAACCMGALCAGLEETDPRYHALRRYGQAVGLMFQVVDDLIDVEQSAEHAGKRTGKDQLQGKRTYPTLFGLEGARRQRDQLCAQALEAAASLGEKGRPLRRLCEQMARRTR